MVFKTHFNNVGTLDYNSMIIASTAKLSADLFKIEGNLSEQTAITFIFTKQDTVFTIAWLVIVCCEHLLEKDRKCFLIKGLHICLS